MEDLVIYNYATFTNTNNWQQDDAKIICRTTVGDEYGFSVTQVSSETDFAEEIYLWNPEIEIPATETIFSAVYDPEAYQTDDDGENAWAICTIQLEVNENNWEELESIFASVYDATYGIKVFDPTTEEMTQYAESDFSFYLPSPRYENDYDEPVYDVKLDETFQGSGDYTYQRVQIQLETSPYWTADDYLAITFETEFAPVNSAGYVVQWAQYRLQEDYYGQWTTVACVMDQSTSTVEVRTYVGDTYYDDDSATQ